jgi:glycerol-3-phosphate dehydrogenase
MAELKYCVENEVVAELSDFLIRRTGKIYFNKKIADKYATILNEELAKLLNLSKDQEKKSLNTYLSESADVLNFKT